LGEEMYGVLSGGLQTKR